MCRWMIHRARLAHGGWRVGATCGKRGGEVGGNFRREDGSGRGEDELLGDNTEEGLSKTYMRISIGVRKHCNKTERSPRTLLPPPTMMSESQRSLRFVASGTARMV